ncbi:MAG TPA: hypothetical protein PLA68_04980 [Panacibacter sp.]|nr:hypothetical protein [Panacibacter sp.]
MKIIIASLLILNCFCNCSEKKETIDFITLNENEFNLKPFELEYGKIPDSAKKAHDSCMGFSFNANVILTKTKDTFFIGSIVNRQSLKILNALSDLGLTEKQLISQFNIVSEPCYEKRTLHFPIRALSGENFRFQLSGADAAANKEINDAISVSTDAEIQSGPWVYLDMKDVLKNIMDTTKSAAGLNYKKNLLDTANMILTTVESITSISFMIYTKKDISNSLQGLLKTNPFASLPGAKFTIQFSYIDKNKFKMSFNGFFPAAGEFMRAELK